MTQLPVVDFRTLERILGQWGFKRVRQKGNHVIFRHPDGRGTSVPHHPGRDLSRPLIRIILREIEASIEDYLRALEEL